MEDNAHAFVAEMQLGMQYSGYYLLLDPMIKTSPKGGNPFLQGILADKSGQTKVMQWNYFKTDTPESGTVIYVEGTYQQKPGTPPGFVANTLSAVDANESVDMSGLIPAAREDPAKLMEDAERFINSITEPHLQAVARSIFADNHDSLEKWPGAKTVHHAYIGGLLQHEVELCRIADAIIPTLPIDIDRDLLITACILHDVGKLREFKLNKVGLVSEYTAKGNLLGHLYMGAEYVGLTCRRCGVDPETEMMLQHMILSHHGEPEYGSVKRPMFPEAIVLHAVDSLDAQLETVRIAYEHTDAGKFTEYIFGVGNTRMNMYKSLKRGQTESSGTKEAD